MNLLSLPIGTIIQVKSKEEVEKEYGTGFVGVKQYENQYGKITSVSQSEGCYYIKDFNYGWDDRLVKKVDNPIGIFLVEYDGEITSEKYCDEEDIQMKTSILENMEFDKHEYNKIVVETV